MSRKKFQQNVEQCFGSPFRFTKRIVKRTCTTLYYVHIYYSKCLTYEQSMDKIPIKGHVL